MDEFTFGLIHGLIYGLIDELIDGLIDRLVWGSISGSFSGLSNISYQLESPTLLVKIKHFDKNVEKKIQTF